MNPPNGGIAGVPTSFPSGRFYRRSLHRDCRNDSPIPKPLQSNQTDTPNQQPELHDLNIRTATQWTGQHGPYGPGAWTWALFRLYIHSLESSPSRLFSEAVLGDVGPLFSQHPMPRNRDRGNKIGFSFCDGSCSFCVIVAPITR